MWIRKVSLKVGTAAGTGLDLSNLRIKFEIKKHNLQSPNMAEILVYNLEKNTELKIQKEFTRVILQAGYESNFGVIFDGNTKQIMRGRENGTDSYLSIVAADGDAAYNFAVVNKTLPAGMTQDGQILAAGAPMLAHGVMPGQIMALNPTRLPRGKTMYGMSNEYLRQSARSTNAHWSIQDGKLNVVPIEGFLKGNAVLLTSSTGLIETPEQTDEGIKIKCLINPQLKVGGRINIKDSAVNLQKKIPGQITGVKQQTTPLEKVSYDGSYKIIAIKFDGDTHGNEWYQTLTCVDIDATALPAALTGGGMAGPVEGEPEEVEE